MYGTPRNDPAFVPGYGNTKGGTPCRSPAVVIEDDDVVAAGAGGLIGVKAVELLDGNVENLVAVVSDIAVVVPSDIAIVAISPASQAGSSTSPSLIMVSVSLPRLP